MNKFWAVVLVVALAALVSEYFVAPDKKGDLIMPQKESTWVKTEKVKLTKEEALSGIRQSPQAINVDEELKARLMTANVSGDQSVTDSASCLLRVMPLDAKRTAVQKAGGAWRMFERHPETKIYSNHGMQIDSKTNMMIFALRHLCETAKGVPMDSLAANVSQQVEEKGREDAKDEIVKLLREPETADIWLDYAESAKKNETRVVDFKTINDLVSKAEPLIDFYVELSKLQVDKNNLQGFLSDAVTLLDVLNQFLSQDKYMVMALQEDKSVPQFQFSGEM